jgi:hypothetical protein
MTVQVVVGQRSAQPTATPEVLVSPDAVEPNQQQPAMPPMPVAVPTAEIGRVTAPQFSSGTVALVGVSTLAAVALFGTGLMWRRIMPALRTFRYRAEDISIPVALPVVVAEVWWETLVAHRVPR